MVKILFVDDEKNVLDGLRRAMYSMRSEWSMSFATSGAEALSKLGEMPADVVVTDMRMPGMSGREVLFEVKRLYPQTIRFVLSGYADSSSVMQVAGTAHQYLSKPCDIATLKAALSRAFALRQLLHDERLVHRIGSVDSLPSLPSIYQKIVACLQGPDPELADVARIISSDVVMTAMVLKLANSAFFGAGKSFRTAERAVSFLGLDTIAGLVLAHSIFNDAGFERSGVDLEKLWRHSVLTATGARALALSENWSAQRAEDAFLAGVLHEIGRLVLAIRGAHPEAGPEEERETTHAEAGAYLLGLWGFSDDLIEAIAFHRTPSKAASKEFGLPGLLHVASRFAHLAAENALDRAASELEPGYLESLGLSGRLKDWQAVWSKASGQEAMSHSHDAIPIPSKRMI